MNFGYLIFAAKNENFDYVKMAYLLALTIKLTQKDGYNNVALITDEYDQTKYKSPWVFDKVIVEPLRSGWDSRIDMFDFTPWEHTVCLDADMIFLRDMSHAIDHFVKNCDLYIANKAYTYRGEVVHSDYYRKTFIKNQLPNLYSFFTFFKKPSDTASKFFSLCATVDEYKDQFKNVFLSQHIPKVLGTDEIFALSANLLDIADEVSYDLNFPRVVHLKPMIQNWWEPTHSVIENVGFYLNFQAEIKIGNFQQHDIIHYQEKYLANDETTSIVENMLWKK